VVDRSWQHRTTDNHTVTNAWGARYPDLTGKVVVVAGDSPRLVAVVHGFASNGALLAVVAADREIVGAAVGVAETLRATVLGLAADPRSAAVWSRTMPHVEQRLGPIDVAVALGDDALRACVSQAVLPDMNTRGRGLFVEVDAGLPAPTTRTRDRRIQVHRDVADSDLAAAVLLCSSDSVSAATMTVTLQ
jgi:hypothetical protein